MCFVGFNVDIREVWIYMWVGIFVHAKGKDKRECAWLWKS